MDIISWIKTTLSKYSSNNTHDKNAIYFVKNEDGKTGKIISDEVVYGNGGGANEVIVESPNQPTGGESVWVNPDEDTEEVEVYSRQQIDALINTKQNELTLTVEDNGNIVIGNIRGQTKEFMPATPSGDPMHYAYVAAGAEYNDTGADIVKTTPWADMLDDDYDGECGKTVIHKAGYWYLNGLGDITNEEIRKMYIATSNFPPSPYLQSYFSFVDFRTNFRGIRQITGWAIMDCSSIVAGGQKFKILNLSTLRGAFLNISQLSSVMHIIGSNFFLKSANSFENSEKLVTISIKRLEYNVNAGKLPVLSVKSVLFMIQNEAAKSPITITLHADVYNRCMANADVLAALEKHPNVSLASA